MNKVNIQYHQLLKGINEHGYVYEDKSRGIKRKEISSALIDFDTSYHFPAISTKKVAENRTYKLGDEVKAYGKNCKIVEVLDVGRYHLKNLQEPYDSFVALVELCSV